MGAFSLDDLGAEVPRGSDTPAKPVSAVADEVHPAWCGEVQVLGKPVAPGVLTSSPP